MKKTAKAPSEETLRALLERHGCPVSFHEVRTRFLGNIATLELSASPLRVVEGLWGGELPVFESMDEANELIRALVQGLWSDLTRHQKRSQPFRLTLVPLEPTAASLGHSGLVRLQELDGFIEGLFNGEETIDLPEQAHKAIGCLSELRAMMAAICGLASRASDVDDRAQHERTSKNLRKLTRIMETEINKAVLSCTRARRQMLEGILEGILTEKPTIH
ncbi:MAG: hypothetical protein GY792_24395 [Gammaproteobacteria bacterium]|nr:hypothetical protein [Gammaproteobacteria bacterium]